MHTPKNALQKKQNMFFKGKNLALRGQSLKKYVFYFSMH
jgi:hypothetical protein